MNADYLIIARDPAIIPGVHHHCDEWCDYCPVTRRCLVFRCLTEFRRQHGRSDASIPFVNLEEAIAFTRELAAIEGTRTDELDALAAAPPGQSGIETRDPLAATAWEYAVRAALFMMPAARALTTPRPGPAGPGPVHVVLWYHLRIYMVTFRALVARERGDGCADRIEHATGCAKLALVSVQRSRAALQALRGGADDGEIQSLISLLETLEQGVDERFPHARAFVRVGLDCPVA
jgi:hypothetical protein